MGRGNPGNRVLPNKITYRGTDLLDLVFPIFFELKDAYLMFIHSFSKDFVRGSVLHSRNSSVRRAPSVAITSTQISTA